MTAEVWIIMLVSASGHSIQTAGTYYTQQDCAAAAASIQSQRAAAAYCVAQPLTREHRRQLDNQEQERGRAADGRDTVQSR